MHPSERSSCVCAPVEQRPLSMSHFLLALCAAAFLHPLLSPFLKEACSDNGGQMPGKLQMKQYLSSLFFQCAIPMICPLATDIFHITDDLFSKVNIGFTNDFLPLWQHHVKHCVIFDRNP